MAEDFSKFGEPLDDGPADFSSFGDPLEPGASERPATQVTTRFTREPPRGDRMPPAEDDWSTLGRKFVENLPALGKQIVGGAARQIGEAPDERQSNIQAGERVMRAKAGLENLRQRAKGELSEWGKRAFADATADLAENAPNVDPESLKGYAYDLSVGLAQLGPAVAASIATRNPAVGAGIMYGEVSGQTYGQQRAEGRSVAEANQDAMVFAAAEAIPEMIPLGFLIKPGGKLLGRVFKTAGAEAAQEILTQAIQDGYSAGVLNEEMTWEQALNNMKRAGILGAGMGGTVAAGTHWLTPGPKPTGEIERSSAAAPRLTPEDVASPIPNELIVQGKAIVGQATAAGIANSILSRVGLPPVNSRVRLRYQDGREIGGVMVDGFTTESQATGVPVDGVKIKLDNGTIFEEFADTIRTAGVQIVLEGPAKPAQQAPAAETPAMVAQIQPTETAAPPDFSAHGDAVAPIEPTNGTSEISVTDSALETARVEGQHLGVAQQGPAHAGLRPDPEETAPAGDGTRAAPVTVQTAEDIDRAGSVAAEPTEAQKEANNYAHGHVRVHGLDVSIETPKGAMRRGKSPDGTEWENESPAAYGYIKRSEGADGDHVDVYLGPDPQAPTVFVVDQFDPKTSKFDETKSIIGASSEVEALALYDGGFSDGSGPNRRAGVTAMSVEDFKSWLANADHKKPASGLPRILPVSRRVVAEQKQQVAKPTTFKTSKGSTYTVHEDGTTTRDKAARSDHPGDSGLKRRSAVTVYADKQTAAALNPGGMDGGWRIMREPDGTFSMLTKPERGDWGYDPSAKKLKVSTTSAIGLQPIEVWDAETLRGREVFRGAHIGNAITSIGDEPVTVAEVEPDQGAKIQAEPAPQAALKEKMRAKRAEKVAPRVVDFETFAAERGASRQDIGDVALHRSSKNVPRSTWKRFVEADNQRSIEVIKRRNALWREYQGMVDRGEIRSPTSAERLADTAQGMDEKESVQAARRVIEKRASRQAAESPTRPDLRVIEPDKATRQDALKAKIEAKRKVDAEVEAARAQKESLPKGETQREAEKLGPPAGKPRPSGIKPNVRDEAELERLLAKNSESRNRATLSPAQKRLEDQAREEIGLAFDRAADNPVAQWGLRADAAMAEAQQHILGTIKGEKASRFEQAFNDALSNERGGVAAPQVAAAEFLAANPRPEGPATVTITTRTARGQETTFVLPNNANKIREQRDKTLGRQPGAQYAMDSKGLRDPESERVPSQKFHDDFEDIAADLRQRMQDLGISEKISLNVAERLTYLVNGQERSVSGSYFDGLIEVSLSGRFGPSFALNHESIHAMRDLGLFTDPEWQTLERAALQSPRMAEVSKRYQPMGLSEAETIEEVVADMFAAYADQKRLTPMSVRDLLERIRSFLRALGDALFNAGYRTADDIFSEVDRGAMARRQPRDEAGRFASDPMGGIDEPGPMGMSPRFMATAYHGSPHDFDEFSTAKIGTGEGNQSFGWGLYFAGKRGVAEHYRRQLAGGDVLVKGFLGRWRPFNGIDEMESAYGQSAFTQFGADLDAALGYLNDKLKQQVEARDGSHTKEARAMWQGKVAPLQRDVDKLEKIKKNGGVRRAGTTFQVDLAPAEDDYLLWDKPISEQSEKVRAALANLGERAPQNMSAKASKFYDDLALSLYDKSGQTVGGLHFPSVEGLGDEAAASKILREAGIPGIKYLDQGSRNSGGWKITPPDRTVSGKWMVKSSDYNSKGLQFDTEEEAQAALAEKLGSQTYNYVIFDEKDVKIEAKLALDPRPERPAGAADTMAFDNAASEVRWQEARKGIAGSDSMIAKTEEWLSHLWHGFSRHFIELPNSAKYADLTQQLRKLEAAPQASKEKVVRILRQLTEGMNAKDLDLFTRKVVLDDLSWEVEQEHLLPFGMSEDDVTREKAKVDAIIERRLDLREAVRRRKLIIRQVANDLVRIGVLHRDQVKNPAYYRHQVLDYARAVTNYAKGTGKKLRTPYWAKRMGSTLDINANLLEAEFDWLQKAFMGIETVKTIDWIKRSEHNIRRAVISAARAHNDRLVREMLDAEGEGGPLNQQWKRFRQQIAMGLAKVKKAIDDGDLHVPEEFEEVAANLTGDVSNDVSVFPFMAWVMDNGDAGAAGAATTFKGVSQRREWIKRQLGSKYADTTNVVELVKRFAPEGYVAWQPDSPDGRGKALRLYVAKTIPEAAIDRMVEQVMRDQEFPAEFAAVIRQGFEAEVKSALTIGSAKYEMVIPEEVATTLNNLRNDFEENVIAHVVEAPTRMWKLWTLFNPRRVLKYNLNNLSGDLDAVIAGNPRLMKRTPEASRELFNVMVRKQRPSPRYTEAVEHGVFDSGFTVQEIPDINTLSEFERLTKPMNWKNPASVVKAAMAKGWGFVRGATTLRENIFRYATYLDYADRLDAGEPMSKIGYGASKPEIVDAVTNRQDKAALLARDLIGDYGAISAHGQQLRRYVIPFWSFQEINIRRYWRLNANAWQQGVVKGAKTGAVTGAALGAKTTLWLYVRMVVVYGLINIWNNLMFGDDEEDMDPEQRARLHLTVWSDGKGNTTTLRLNGSLSDIFAWFGFEDALAALYEVERGRADLWDVMGAIAKAPVNKVVNGITPVIKAPIEAAAGVTFFPDVFNPRPVRDNWRQLARTFSLENEYDLLTDAPSRGYGSSLAETVVSRRDAGEQAYSRMKGMAAKWLEREKGQDGYSAFSSPRSDALYNLRLAMKYGDREAERATRQQLRDLGATADDIKKSIKRAHPLGGIALKDRGAFLRSLTAEERRVLNRAIQWYDQTFTN